jgi:hypothetical protein
MVWQRVFFNKCSVQVKIFALHARYAIKMQQGLELDVLKTAVQMVLSVSAMQDILVMEKIAQRAKCAALIQLQSIHAKEVEVKTPCPVDAELDTMAMVLYAVHAKPAIKMQAIPVFVLKEVLQI